MGYQWDLMGYEWDIYGIFIRCSWNVNRIFPPGNLLARTCELEAMAHLVRWIYHSYGKNGIK